jgi:hypothetical protein
MPLAQYPGDMARGMLKHDRRGLDTHPMGPVGQTSMEEIVYATQAIAPLREFLGVHDTEANRDRVLAEGRERIENVLSHARIWEAEFLKQPERFRSLLSRLAFFKNRAEVLLALSSDPSRDKPNCQPTDPIA